MLGLNDLDINLTWKFRFYGHGSAVVALPGTVYIDIGGTVEDGIFDHHSDENTYKSSASAIADNPERVLRHLLGPLNHTRLSGQKIDISEITFCFATHICPDWDGVVSLYLVDYLVRNGELPKRNVVKALVDSADIIDQGLAKIEGKTQRPYLLYLLLMESIRDNTELILEGKCLLEHIIQGRKHWEITKWTFLDEFEVPEPWSDQLNILEKDYKLFLEDIKNSQTIDLHFPRHSNTAKLSSLLVFEIPPRCILHKYWVREKIKPAALMIPLAGEAGEQIERVIISTDPSSDYCLPLLGWELEQKESQKRKILKLERSGYPRFETEYCDNSDPWYDGRGHDFTIVDSPHCGTILNYDEIIEVSRKLFQKPVNYVSGKSGIDAFISYRRTGGSDLAWTLKTILEQRHKKNAFLDVENLGNGRFDDQLRHNLEICRNFVLLLSPGALDRCSNPEDWVRQEIEFALTNGKNIIPVMMDGFDYDSFGVLPPGIQSLAKSNGVLLKHEYYQEGINKIVQFMD